MIPGMSQDAWRALEDLAKARRDGHPPLAVPFTLAVTLQANRLAIERSHGGLEITSLGERALAERSRQINSPGS